LPVRIRRQQTPQRFFISFSLNAATSFTFLA